jgi:hypothetical protein
MSVKHFNVECIADEPVYVRIKRFDGLFYNQYSQEFENDPNLTISLAQTDGLLWVASPPIEATHEEFPPGRYTVYYHSYDGTFKGSYIDIPNETTPSEVANRVANIQIGEGSLRFALNKISKQVDEILKILKTKESNTM